MEMKLIKELDVQDSSMIVGVLPFVEERLIFLLLRVNTGPDPRGCKKFYRTGPP
jgi:hypothetical protein